MTSPPSARSGPLTCGCGLPRHRLAVVRAADVRAGDVVRPLGAAFGNPPDGVVQVLVVVLDATSVPTQAVRVGQRCAVAVRAGVSGDGATAGAVDVHRGGHGRRSSRVRTSAAVMPTRTARSSARRAQPGMRTMNTVAAISP